MLFLLLLLLLPGSISSKEIPCPCQAEPCHLEGQLIRLLDEPFPGDGEKTLEVLLVLHIQNFSVWDFAIWANDSSLSVDWLPEAHDTEVPSRRPPLLSSLQVTGGETRPTAVLIRLLFSALNMRLRSSYEVKMRSVFHLGCRQLIPFRPVPTLVILFACERIRGATCENSIPADMAPTCGLIKHFTPSTLIGDSVNIDFVPQKLPVGRLQYLVAIYGLCQNDSLLKDYCTLDLRFGEIRFEAQFRSAERQRYCLPGDLNYTIALTNVTEGSRYGIEVCAVRDPEKETPSTSNDSLIHARIFPASSLDDVSPSRSLLPLLLPLVALAIFLVWTMVQKRRQSISLPKPVLSKQISDPWELDDCDLHIDYDSKLGRGAFGSVYLGSLTADYRSPACGPVILDERHRVAVKVLNRNADPAARESFLAEMEINKSIGRHARLVNIIGVTTRCEPLCLVMEYCANGDLLRFLRVRRDYMLQLQEAGVDLSIEDPEEHADVDFTFVLTLHDIFRYALQICSGMEYLTSRHFIHRDLACRNVMVTADYSAKISDFGLCRHADDEECYLSRGGNLPLKWMAPEALKSYRFSTASDVWSFGVVLWELVSLGGSPFPDVAPQQLLPRLQAGLRLPRPENCGEKFYAVMVECWKLEPAERPSFTSLRERLTDLFENCNLRDNTSSYYLKLDAASEYYKEEEELKPANLSVINEDEKDEESEATEQKEKDETEAKDAMRRDCEDLLMEAQRLLGFHDV